MVSPSRYLLLSVSRYVTNILEDAKVYSQHAGKKNIDVDDVKLSVSLSTEQTFTSPPPREALLELARVKNSVQLPIPQNKLGLRLPPDRHCLTNTNYKLKGQNKPSGFDYGVSNTTFRGKGSNKTSNNPTTFSVVNNKVVGEDNNINSQPVFKIQVQPQAMKRKLEDMNE